MLLASMGVCILAIAVAVIVFPPPAEEKPAVADSTPPSVTQPPAAVEPEKTKIKVEFGWRLEKSVVAVGDKCTLWWTVKNIDKTAFKGAGLMVLGDLYKCDVVNVTGASAWFPGDALAPFIDCRFDREWKPGEALSGGGIVFYPKKAGTYRLTAELRAIDQTIQLVDSDGEKIRVTTELIVR